MLNSARQPSKAAAPISVSCFSEAKFTAVRALQFLKALSLISCTAAGMLTLSKEVHIVKAEAWMMVTVSGMVMDFKERQLSKLPRIMVRKCLSTSGGKITSWRELHPHKACRLRHASVLGIFSFTKDLQPLKAEGPMEDKPSGIWISASEWQPSKTLSEICLREFPWNVTWTKDRHPLKAPVPTYWTALGMLTLFKDLQPWKEAWVIRTSESGSLTVIRDEQSLKANLPSSVTELGMVRSSNELQALKLKSPMLVREHGNSTLRNEEQSSKAYSPMAIKESLMVKLTKELQFRKAPGAICVVEAGIFTASKSSGSQPASSFLQHSTTCLEKITCNSDSGEMPSAATVLSFPSFFPSRSSSTLVVKRMSSSAGSKVFSSFFNSQILQSSITSTLLTSPPQRLYIKPQKSDRGRSVPFLQRSKRFFLLASAKQKFYKHQVFWQIDWRSYQKKGKTYFKNLPGHWLDAPEGSSRSHATPFGSFYGESAKLFRPNLDACSIAIDCSITW